MVRLQGLFLTVRTQYLVDDPLNGDCSVVVSRDCKKGDTIRECGPIIVVHRLNSASLVNAITNYTSRVQDESLDDTQREEALKFLGG
jgi:hypothetical protein